MQREELDFWLEGYLDTFAACGRGERDPAAVLDFYVLPVLLSTDDLCVILREESDLLEWARGQVEDMLAADFDRIEVLDRAVDHVNATTALVRGAFARRRRDGSDITRLTASYLLVKQPDRLRSAALMVHSPTRVS